MERYNIINKKNQREIVLLKAFPCKWGKCSFCDYIDDNSTSEDEINKINSSILEKITGEYKILEVINSGSCFEIPLSTLEKIKEVIDSKKIEKLFLESHWIYRNRLDEMRNYFEIPIVFKVGIETFDHDFRNKVLFKNTRFNTPEQVRKYFDSPCLMVGIKGQTKDMIAEDIKILEKHFDYGTINVFTPNSSNFQRDQKLIDWFLREYSYLDQNPQIEVLYNNTDFGVGD